MPELIRNIANRLREIVGNRRRAPRFLTHLDAELALIIALPHASASGQGAGQPLKLTGYTRDISANGLALVVPAIRIGGHYITGENSTLEVTLKLPTGTIEVRATPVRYSPLEKDAAETGYLIGAQIISMSNEDRSHFNAHLETLK